MNRTKEGRGNPSETPSRGIPPFSRAEKLTVVVPVKLQPSVKQAIPKPQSTWIRQVILEQLERMRQEA